ncbi:MAG: PEP-utilizing enzyme [Patescibacteria group bacterium]|jgi:phosphohistidine swiveling domain-containing protein
MNEYRVLAAQPVRPRNPHDEWLEKDYTGFPHTIFMQGIHAGVFLAYKRYPFGFRIAYSYSFIKHGESRLDFFWDARELKRVRQYFIAKSTVRLDFFMKFYHAWKRDLLETIRAYNRVEKINWHSLSHQELYDTYHRLYWTNMRQGAHGYLADSFLTAGTDDWLTTYIKKRIPVEMPADHAVEVLTAATIPSYTNEAEQALCRLVPLAKKYRGTKKLFTAYAKKQSPLWKKLVRHAQQWYWIENNYYARVLTPDYFAGQLYDLAFSERGGSLVKRFRRNTVRKRVLLRRINDRALANIIRISELMTHVQDYRKMSLVRFSHFLHLIFTEVGRRWDIPEEHLQYSIEPEMKDIFLHGAIDKKKIRERKKKSFFFGTPFGYHFYHGKEVSRYVRDADFIPPTKGIRQIQGTSASTGIATGKVRLVMNAHAPGKFMKGDILVTNNTTPEYVPLMKKAGAIVTDQGGITTHAAIVSRELGIPCVIGTKVATKVLKTGDRVEVDALSGIVRKLS